MKTSKRALPGAKVGLAKTGRRRSNVFEAMDNIREELTPKVREQVAVETELPLQHESTRLVACGCDARRVGLLAQHTEPADRGYHRRGRE